MALERKFLEAMGLPEVQVQAIIDGHVETVKGLIARAETAEKAAENAPAVIKERDELKKQLEELQKAGDAAKIQKAFDDYKASIEAEKTAANKRGAMLDLLKNKVGIARESARKLIVDAMDLSTYELDDNNQFKDEGAIVADMKGKHAEWIGEVITESVPSLNPPVNATRGKGGMTRAEIVKLRDPAERQKAIAENIELFKA